MRKNTVLDQKPGKNVNLTGRIVIHSTTSGIQRSSGNMTFMKWDYRKCRVQVQFYILHFNEFECTDRPTELHFKWLLIVCSCVQNNKILVSHCILQV
jgi:hypothetical protein